MDTLFVILAVLCAAAVPVLLVLFIVKWIRKKPKRDSVFQLLPALPVY